ncbi:MAG: trypsin-like peptidase domain-containing protein [Candidatus Cloacimonetes bacterium]|nr:trypsin-like peptidase domain-containing protein [Candidatus Cloacimonadota bacterium]
MRAGSVIIIVLAVIILNAGITMMIINGKDQSQSAPTPVASAEDASRQNSITAAVNAVEPAVVSINVIKTESIQIRRPFGIPFFDFFDFAPMQRQVQSIGTGIIYDPKGYIITNAHVVEGATQIKVVLPDKREFDATVLGVDDKHDIAKLKINGSRLTHARLGSSQNLIIGEWAIALGNPYGFLMNDSKPSVSVGVISALNRSFSPRADQRSYRNMIQTDAAINPGNSGGPLVNINGEVVGINTFIFSESGGNVGIGFAIPIDDVKSILAKL